MTMILPGAGVGVAVGVAVTIVLVVAEAAVVGVTDVACEFTVRETKSYTHCLDMPWLGITFINVPSVGELNAMIALGSAWMVESGIVVL
jgi:hypothetical protein